MKKSHCTDLIEELAKFLLKNKSMYSQNMSKAIKEPYDYYKIGCGNDDFDITICFCKKKGKKQ